MRRREPAQAGPVVPVEFRGPAVIEDWVTAEEIELHSFGASCTACALRRDGQPANCSFALEFAARSRWRAARDEWLAEVGIEPRNRLAAKRALSLPDGRPRWKERAS